MTQYSGLPRHIARFCNDELFFYDRLCQAVADLDTEREDLSLAGGNLGLLSPVGIVDGGDKTSSPTYAYIERREALLNGDPASSLRVRKERIEGVLEELDNDERYIFDCFYHHRMKQDEIAQAAGWEEYVIFDLRALVMTRPARAWGMI